MSSRLSRKEIKRDEVLESVGSAVDFVRRHGKTLLLGAGALVVVAIAALVWTELRAKQRTAANEVLAEAIAVYQAPIDAADPRPDDRDAPSFADERARAARATELLERVRSEYSGTAAADVAKLYLGDLAAEAGDLDRAAQLWDEFLRRQKGHLLAAQVRVNRMVLERARGGAEAVARELQAMVDDPGAALPQPIVLHQLGLTLEQLGRSDEAHDVYQRLAEEHPASPYRTLAERQAEILESESEG